MASGHTSVNRLNRSQQDYFKEPEVKHDWGLDLRSKIDDFNLVEIMREERERIKA